MAESKVSYGWTGKMARVNLTTGQVTVESTEPYEKFVGGMGLGNKIFYDEVKPGTDPFSPESKLVYSVGPLTASGVPLGGRMDITLLSTYTKDHMVVDAHCGGMLAPRIKFAGWDAIIVEGASETPVFIHIKDDKITIEDATPAWGLGTREATAVLNKLTSNEACVGVIGIAGENLLPYACMMNSRNHSAGAGLGSIMGSKKLKAIVAEGSGSVYVADPKKVGQLSDYMISEIIGSNNNHVMPSTQQAWAEYYDAGSRWTSQKGGRWELAEGGPIDTGNPFGKEGEGHEPKPYELNTMGYRCFKSVKDNGMDAAKYTIKMDGCFSCPVHCYSDLRVPTLKNTTGYEIAGNTCVPDFPFLYMQGILGKKVTGDDYIVWNLTIGNLVDELGLWCNYAQLYRDIAHCHKEGVFKRVLPADEYAKYNWDGLNPDTYDPTCMVDILTDIAKNDSEIAYIGYGPLVWCERWDDMDWFDTTESCLINYRGWPVHHAHECYGQVGAVYNMMFNRDDMMHSAVNMQGCGLPTDIKRAIARETWGGDDEHGEWALDEDKNYTPMNEYKARFTWWCLVTDVLYNALILCSWVWPMTMSPTKQRNYRGDLDLDAKFYNAVTGKSETTESLYEAGARILTLQRAIDVRDQGTYDLRRNHDVYTEWPFSKDPDIEPFTPGTDKMEKTDFQLALTMVYRHFGWDLKYGCPTRRSLERYDMKDVADDLEALGLLPPDDDALNGYEFPRSVKPATPEEAKAAKEQCQAVVDALEPFEDLQSYRGSNEA